MPTRKSESRFVMIAGLACLVLMANLTRVSLGAAGRISITLDNGRRYTAQVDPRTDSDRLWIRYGNESVTLLRPIHWPSIVSAEYEGREISLDQLRVLATETQTKPAQSSAANSQADREENSRADHDQTNSGSDTHGETFADRARLYLGAAEKVRSIEFDARLANWDADAETDGLIVHIYPLAADGRVVAIGGTAHVELIAPRQRNSHDVRRANGAVTTIVAQWSQHISAQEVGSSGAVIKLPFQAIHPEFDAGVGARGLVHLRLTVPGHGVFESSRDAVRIRRYASLRDER